MFSVLLPDLIAARSGKDVSQKARGRQSVFFPAIMQQIK